jgi:hypothetical protein
MAGDLMTRPAVTIGPDELVRRAARLMYTHSLRRLPVVDRDGRLAGILSRADVLSVFTRPGRLAGITAGGRMGAQGGCAARRPAADRVRGRIAASDDRPPGRGRIRHRGGRYPQGPGSGPGPVVVIRDETFAAHRQVGIGVADLDHCADSLAFAFEEASLRQAILTVIHAWHAPQSVISRAGEAFTATRAGPWWACPPAPSWWSSAGTPMPACPAPAPSRTVS